jgi:hypothetical protein
MKQIKLFIKEVLYWFAMLFILVSVVPCLIIGFVMKTVMGK